MSWELLRGSPVSSTSTPCHMLAPHAPWILHYLVRSCEMEHALSMEDPRYGFSIGHIREADLQLMNRWYI
jgi:hypothetical protein